MFKFSCSYFLILCIPIPPPTLSLARLGKMSSDSDRSSPVFNFPVANEKEPDIQFGSAPGNATPPINGDTDKDQTGVSLNVNANEFVPSNRSVTKGGEASQYPVTEGISPLPLVQPPPHAFYYPYYHAPWVPDPRYVQHAFYPHFGHHGYRYQIPGTPAMGGPQVAVVSPYRTSGDTRPSVRVSEEKVRGNEYSVPDPLKSHVPLSPNSLPSPPSTHGDSGIDLAQPKSVSPPPSAHSLTERPSSVNDIHSTVETPPIIRDDTSIKEIEPINQTTPTHEITTPTILKTPSRTMESNADTSETTNFETSPGIKKADDHTPKPMPTKQSNKKTEHENLAKVPPLQNEDKKTTPTNNKSKPPQSTPITKSASSKTTPAKKSIINNNKLTTPTGKKNNVASAKDMQKTNEATPTAAPPTKPSVMSWASIVGNNGSNSATPINQVQQPPKQSVTKKTPSVEKKVTVTQSNKQPSKMTEEDKTRLKLLGG